jgi:hypothetical protein
LEPAAAAQWVMIPAGLRMTFTDVALGNMRQGAGEGLPLLQVRSDQAMLSTLHFVDGVPEGCLQLQTFAEASACCIGIGEQSAPQCST